MNTGSSAANYALDTSDGLAICLSGAWLMRHERPDFESVRVAIVAIEDAQQSQQTLRFQSEDLQDWDTGLLLFVRRCYDSAAQAGLTVDFDGLPEGAQNMMRLSLAVPEQKQSGSVGKGGFFAKVGDRALDAKEGVDAYLVFLGTFFIDVMALFKGKAQMRMQDFFLLLQQTGPQAVGIVALLNGLTGLIIAFIGVIQLQKFAADIFVADLVGVATTRELGAVITGVIMAGRTGAAFAAQLGSMQVNEEVDALQTFGISPMQFLVLPRVLALVLMMPILTAIGDLVGILGGMVIAVSISDVSVIQYFNQIDRAVDLNDYLIGIFKGAIFGSIIGIAGCYRGLTCGRDASAVGMAATSAVVTSITWLVVADAVFAVMFHILGL